VEVVERGRLVVGCINLIFGAILPRLALLSAWSNDGAYWNALFGSQIWLGLGFIALPWTTLIYGLVNPNGLTLLNIIFLVLAFLGDLGTWGMGFFGGRKEYSNYRSA
jgi:hypothetical protein